MHIRHPDSTIKTPRCYCGAAVPMEPIGNPGSSLQPRLVSEEYIGTWTAAAICKRCRLMLETHKRNETKKAHS